MRSMESSNDRIRPLTLGSESRVQWDPEPDFGQVHVAALQPAEDSL